MAHPSNISPDATDNTAYESCMGTQHTRSDSYTWSSGPSVVQVSCIVPVAPYGACETAWHRREQPVVVACGVVPGAAIVPLVPSIVHIPALQRETKKYYSFGSSLLVSSSIRQRFTLSDLLDKSWSQMSSLPPGTCLHFYRG